MDFSYAEVFGGDSPPAYQTLLLDVMLGDATLFTRSDEVEAAWTVIDPLLKYFEQHPPASLPQYKPGTWGPDEAEELPSRTGSRWR
jgi:glucose-6-phosphate 1-dehydrogenase